MKDILKSIRETENVLKLDVDWSIGMFRVYMRVFNFLYCFPDAKITLSSSGEGYHLFAPVKSSLEVRRGLGDCKGRIYLSEMRGGDIIYRWKATFKVEKVDGGEKVKWVRKPRGDRVVKLRWILFEPFWSKIPRGVYVKMHEKELKS